MASRAIILLLSLILIGPVLAEAGETVVLSTRRGDWYALRIQVGTELASVFGEVRKCANATSAPMYATGHASFYFLDGRPVLSTLATGGAQWGIGSEVATIGVQGETIHPTLLDGETSCGYGTDWVSSSMGASHNLTLLILPLAPSGEVRFRYSGAVGEPEILSGHAAILMKTEFDQGAHADAYAWSAAAGAGALQSHQETMGGPSVGWFWPELPGTAGVTSAACTKSGVPCDDPASDGLYFLNAAKPETWELSIGSDVRAGERPYYVAGIVDLPAGLLEE